VQRKFVETMLASTSFNKQFSAARECHALLARAANVDTCTQGTAVLQVRGCASRKDEDCGAVKACKRQRQLC
jgi:hypothetical protein